MTKLDFIIFLCALVIFGFILGWIFPVEGPIDYVYDKYASAPAHKRPVVAAPQQKHSIVINIEELSLEDLQLIEELFKYSKGERHE